MSYTKRFCSKTPNVWLESKMKLNEHRTNGGDIDFKKIHRY